MEREKMIDEILYKFCESYGFESRCDKSGKKCADMSCAIRQIATEIVNNHIPEGAVVLTKEELVKAMEEGYIYDTTKGNKINIIEMARELERKETAREILNKIGNLDDDGLPMRCYAWFQELAMVYGVEVE